MTERAETPLLRFTRLEDAVKAQDMKQAMALARQPLRIPFDDSSRLVSLMDGIARMPDPLPLVLALLERPDIVHIMRSEPAALLFAPLLPFIRPDDLVELRNAALVHRFTAARDHEAVFRAIGQCGRPELAIALCEPLGATHWNLRYLQAEAVRAHDADTVRTLSVRGVDSMTALKETLTRKDAAALMILADNGLTRHVFQNIIAGNVSFDSEERAFAFAHLPDAAIPAKPRRVIPDVIAASGWNGVTLRDIYDIDTPQTRFAVFTQLVRDAAASPGPAAAHLWHLARTMVSTPSGHAFAVAFNERDTLAVTCTRIAAAPHGAEIMAGLIARLDDNTVRMIGGYGDCMFKPFAASAPADQILRLRATLTAVMKSQSPQLLDWHIGAADRADVLHALETMRNDNAPVSGRPKYRDTLMKAREDILHNALMGALADTKNGAVFSAVLKSGYPAAKLAQHLIVERDTSVTAAVLAAGLDEKTLRDEAAYIKHENDTARSMGRSFPFACEYGAPADPVGIARAAINLHMQDRAAATRKTLRGFRPPSLR